MSKLIVVAHLPHDPAANRDADLADAEWVIFEGRHAEAQATAKRSTWTRYFRHVAVHTLGQEVR